MGKTFRRIEYVEDKETAEVESINVEVDVVPDINSNEPVSNYRDWDRNNTRVITYATKAGLKRIGVRSVAAAKRPCQQNYGEILEENYVPGRAFLRVRKK